MCRPWGPPESVVSKVSPCILVVVFSRFFFALYATPHVAVFCQQTIKNSYHPTCSSQLLECDWSYWRTFFLNLPFRKDLSHDFHIRLKSFCERACDAKTVFAQYFFCQSRFLVSPRQASLLRPEKHAYFRVIYPVFGCIMQCHLRLKMSYNFLPNCQLVIAKFRIFFLVEDLFLDGAARLYEV